MGSDQTRTLLAVILSGFILIVWNSFFNNSSQEQPKSNFKHSLEEKEVQGIRAQPSRVEKGLPSTSTSARKKKLKVYEISHQENSYRFNNHFDLLAAKTIFSRAELTLLSGPQLPFELFVRSEEGRYTKAFFEFHKQEGRKWEGAGT